MSMVFTMTQCFEEVPEIVSIVPHEEIQEKLKELRDIQKELSDESVEAVDLQAKIDDLITQINNLVAPNNVPLTYTIGLLSAASVGDQVGISDATVTVDIGGVRTTATTDSDGQVVFENLRSGIVAVHVEVAGYSDVSFIADLLVGLADDYTSTGEDFYVTSAIALYPTTAANGAITIDGTLHYDPSRTDDILQTTDPLYGVVNYFTFNTFGDEQPYRPAPLLNLLDNIDVGTTQDILDARIQSWDILDQSVNIFAFMQPNSMDYSFVPPGTAGNIVLAIYEGMFVSAASNASDGTFQLVLPAGNNGNNIRIHLAEFIGDESYFRAENFDTATGSTTVSSKTRSVIFTALYAKIGFATFLPGFSNDFFQSNVNNFSSSVSGANSSLEAKIYFGAKSRDE